MTDSDARHSTAGTANDGSTARSGDAPDVLVAGESLIDFLPDSARPLADVASFERRAGGAPANVAVGLARLGNPPWFWTRFGEDPFGDYLAETLAEAGVPRRFVERDPDAKTALAFVTRDAGGAGDSADRANAETDDADADRAFTFYRDGTADTRLEPGGVPDAALDGASWVALGGVMLAADPGRTATLDLADRAAARDCTVVFDPNARPELWASDAAFADLALEAFDRADVVKATPGDLAAAGIEADDPASLAESVTKFGPHTALLTLGESGSVAHATDDAPWGPATAAHGGYDVDAVDATGAGDAFTAGALAAFADGESSLSAVLSLANAVAALTTTARGAMTALPTREAVDAFRRNASSS
ncbi:carbohydrate kinase family protein [Halorussus halobius]|uniref:carbohydrate kinase family protein n=1 Tax=Halorussus halobius TaxID=1710537 RepID=UPI001092313A|nr:carbohydrate kinase [Halorussus halobius]